MLAAEGVFALTLPLVIGPWSDTFHTPLGRRRPFMAAAIGPMAFALALLAFMPNLWTTALMLCALFFAYYVYEPPYRGLYPDVLPEQVFGRAQGVQHVFRGVAIGGALIGGGFLFHLWRPAPFLAASAVVAVACVRPDPLRHGGRRSGTRLRGRADVCRARAGGYSAPTATSRTFLVANTAWEGTFAGARTFVVLYMTVGLGEPLSTSACVLAAVAGGYIVAALVAGRIGDRFGLARVIIVASCGVRRQACWSRRSRPGVARLVPRPHLPRRDRRRHRDDACLGTALQADAVGRAGRDLGPRDDDEGRGARHRPARGGRCDRPLEPHLEATDGYQALWPVLGVPILLAIPLVARLIRAEAEADRAAALRSSPGLSPPAA